MIIMINEKETNKYLFECIKSFIKNKDTMEKKLPSFFKIYKNSLDEEDFFEKIEDNSIFKKMKNIMEKSDDNEMLKRLFEIESSSKDDFCVRLYRMAKIGDALKTDIKIVKPINLNTNTFEINGKKIKIMSNNDKRTGINEPVILDKNGNILRERKFNYDILIFFNSKVLENNNLNVVDELKAWYIVNLNKIEINNNVINVKDGKSYINIKIPLFKEENDKYRMFDEMIKILKEELIMKRIEDNLNNALNDGVKAIIINGAPGTGKTYWAKKCAEKYVDSKGKVKTVQFHSSYDYTDFIEGLKPVQLTENGAPTFVRMDGAFKSFCREAAKNVGEKYIFIIDEINRADLSRVFGELMYSLEYRGEKVETQYANLITYGVQDREGGKTLYTPIEDDIFDKGFYVPENVIIIGTMNDIDRGIETIDFALRRRFLWIEASCNAEIESLKEEIKNDFIENLKNMNTYIIDEKGGGKFGLNKAYQIGPGYLINNNKWISKKGDLIKIWNYRIKPILQEYVRGYDGEYFIMECEKKFLNNQIDKTNEANKL